MGQRPWGRARPAQAGAPTECFGHSNSASCECRLRKDQPGHHGWTTLSLGLGKPSHSSTKPNQLPGEQSCCSSRPHQDVPRGSLLWAGFAQTRPFPSAPRTALEEGQEVSCLLGASAGTQGRERGENTCSGVNTAHRHAATGQGSHPAQGHPAVPARAVHPLVDLRGAVGPPEVVHCPGPCIFLRRREPSSAALLPNRACAAPLRVSILKQHWGSAALQHSPNTKLW